jgi:hypothetical protein
MPNFGSEGIVIWEIAEVDDLSFARATPEPGSVAGRLVGLGRLVAATIFVIAALHVGVASASLAPRCGTGGHRCHPLAASGSGDAALRPVLDVAIVVAVKVGENIRGPLRERGAT